MFACHLRHRKRWKLATFRRFAWTRKIVYDKYTGFFGTRQEPQKFIKFSDSSGNILIKFSPFYRNCIYSVQGTLCHCEERSDVAISRKGKRLIKKREIVIEIKIFIIVFLSAIILRIFLFFRKMFWKGWKFLKNYFNIRLKFIYLLYSFDGLSI